MAFLCYGFSLSAILLHLIPHAVDLGISAGSAANLIAMIGAASVVGKVWLGSAADRIGNKNVYLIGFLLLAVSLFALIPLTRAVDVAPVLHRIRSGVRRSCSSTFAAGCLVVWHPAARAHLRCLVQRLDDGLCTGADLRRIRVRLHRKLPDGLSRLWAAIRRRPPPYDTIDARALRPPLPRRRETGLRDGVRCATTRRGDLR